MIEVFDPTGSKPHLPGESDSVWGTILKTIGKLFNH